MAETRAELETQLNSFLNKDYFVIVTTPCVGPEIQKVIERHLDNQIKLEKDGVMFAAGPLYEEGQEFASHGMFVIRANSFEEAKAIADEDPLHKMGLRTYTLHKWRVNEGSYTVTVNYSDQTMQIE
jgi:hypothetical protein